MLEISPVLSGKFNSSDFVPNAGNINVSGSAASDGVDARRYTKFDRTISDTPYDPSFSFSDLIDTINPLQHIPVLSDAYRGATDTDIHPTARVAGDILYGGIIGGASGIVGGIAALGDNLMSAKTGTTVSGAVLASLFGDQTTNSNATQIAENNATLPAANVASALPGVADTSVASSTGTPKPVLTADNDQQTRALLEASLGMPLDKLAAETATSEGETAQAPQLQKLAGTDTGQTGANTQPPAITAAPPAQPQFMAAKAFPLTTNKLPFGGVMDATNQQQMQDMALSLAQGSKGTRIGNKIYAGRLLNGANQPVSIPLPNPDNTGNTQGIATAAAGGNSPNPLPQALMNSIMGLKALKQYQGVAITGSPAGSMLDIAE